MCCDFALKLRLLVARILLVWQQPLGHFPTQRAFHDLWHIFGEPCFEQRPEQVRDRVFHRPIAADDRAGLGIERGPGWFTVLPSDGSVLRPTGDNRLTLTACHPKYSAKQRIIVQAKLVAEPVWVKKPEPAAAAAAPAPPPPPAKT